MSATDPEIGGCAYWNFTEIIRMRHLGLGVIAAIAATTAAFITSATNLDGAGDAHAGRQLAVENCSGCHMVTARRLTPHRVNGPPNFVDIANAPDTTARSLYVFLHTSHPTMPDLILSDQMSANVIAYILGFKKTD